MALMDAKVWDTVVWGQRATRVTGVGNAAERRCGLRHRVWQIASALAAAAFIAVCARATLTEMSATSMPAQTTLAPTTVAMSDAEPGAAAAGGATGGAASRGDAASREWAFGGYSGLSYTMPSEVVIENGERTNVRVRDFEWIGRPFKAPIYYGLRAQRWGAGRIGGMLDFTHAKAIADKEDIATFEGSHNGNALPGEAKIDDVFRKLEFSHGHNMVTLNGLFRFTPNWMRIRPYVGGGGGVSLPHTEIGFRADNVRTYEYQYAGLVAQGLAGVEIQLGRASLFLEYKFSYAPYDVPLSHRSPGWLLVTDLWDQLQSWLSGEAQPGGRLTTQLNTHHAIGGVLVKNGSFVSSGPMP